MTVPLPGEQLGSSPEHRARQFRLQRLGLAAPGDGEVVRDLPVEAPVAIEVCGVSYAVMMATPADLGDYATGFAMAEGLIEHPRDILDLKTHALDNGGWVVRLTLPTEGAQKAMARARVRVTESSCGLCGMDNIEQVLRPLPPVSASFRLGRDAISRALADLPRHQPLSRATGGVHAAAFCNPSGEILQVREDVGRHNALDKLVGALAQSGQDPSTGFLLLTARCSYELVEKAVRAGCPALVTISAPTALAAQRAAAAGLTLVALARQDSALVVHAQPGVLELDLADATNC